MSQRLDEIIETFDLIDEWDDKYRYLIDLGRQLAPYPEDHRNDAHKVSGCASQVWLYFEPSASTHLSFKGCSDAHIVRGLIGVLHAAYSGQSKEYILKFDIEDLLKRLGLSDHISAQRANGLRSMIARIQAEAAL
jgi:cysteine desulfuration protein SufE